MKYAFITAALAAAVMANVVVDVEVEGTDVTESRNGHNHHMSRHHEHNRRDHRNHRNGNHWWTDLFNGRNGRRHNDRHRHGRHDRHRNGRNHNGGRRYETDDILDDIFGDSSYECILDARNKGDRREDTRRCCEEQQGALFDERGHCILRDVIRNPRDQWRDCAMEQRGAEWAECYRRETREIDDKLEGRGRNDDDKEDENRRRNRSHDRNGRREHDRDNRNRHHRNGNNRMFEQEILGGGDRDRDGRRGRHGRNDRFECRVELDDQMRREQIARQCCEGQTNGQYDESQQVCRIDDREDRDDFQQCAMEQGAQNAECYRD